MEKSKINFETCWKRGRWVYSSHETHLGSTLEEERPTLNNQMKQVTLSQIGKDKAVDIDVELGGGQLLRTASWMQPIEYSPIYIHAIEINGLDAEKEVLDIVSVDELLDYEEIETELNIDELLKLAE